MIEIINDAMVHRCAGIVVVLKNNKDMSKFLVEIDDQKKDELKSFLELMHLNHFKIIDLDDLMAKKETRSKPTIFEGLKKSLGEVRKVKEGKGKFTTLEDFLNELEEE